MHLRQPVAACLALALLLGLPSCSEDAASGTAQAAAPAVERSGDPRLAEARAALEAGRPSAAKTLLENLGAQAGVEGPLALARAHLALGAVVPALEQVERARELSASDPRVFATSAEILALADQGAAAQAELDQGFALSPGAPDLLRAQAFLHLTRPGEAPLALERLQEALRLDPKTPYVDWPLAQAYFLTGSAALGSGDLAGAIVAARAALELEPELGEAEELLGAAHVSSQDFGAAIAAYERAAELGIDTTVQRAEAHRNAAMAARLQGQHEVAEDHYLALRALGLGQEEFGASGLDYMENRARLAFEVAMAASLRDDQSAAGALFAKAVRLAPEGPLALDAIDGQAGARFRQADYGGAALLWTEVQERELAGPAPSASRTHLNLARARVLGGQAGAARSVLEGYLARFPDGPAAADTRDLLAKLPAE